MNRLAYVLVTFLLTTAVSMAEDGKVIEFRIPDGTGKKAWNTSETTVEVKVGETLRIINDDSTPHRLHTTGGKPCKHAPSNIAKGEHYDCVVTKTADPDVEDEFCYDHNIGPSARFYLRATN